MMMFSCTGRLIIKVIILIMMVIMMTSGKGRIMIIVIMIVMMIIMIFCTGRIIK